MTTPSEYVDRHARMRDGMARMILMTYAANSNAVGRSFLTQAQVAERVSRAVRTVKWHMAHLLRPADGTDPWLRRDGRTYVIRGYAEHDPHHCPLGDCIAEAVGDELAARRRAAGARRARQWRERRRKTG